MLAKRFQFFRPTRRMRELRILGAIARYPNASQRALAERVLLGPTMVHRYIGELAESGLVAVGGSSHRAFEYRLTASGETRRETLLFEATREVVQFYGLVKLEFHDRLRGHADRGATRVVLFGGAETAEIVYAAAPGTGVEIVGIVDNAPERWGQTIGTLRVQSPDVIARIEPDTVLITSFGHAEEIGRGLAHLGDRVRVDLV